MIFLATIFLFIIAGVVGLLNQYQAPKCETLSDLGVM